jgi:hypothetical protein
MLTGVLVALGLTFYGLERFPHTNLRSRAGAISILLVYGFLAWHGAALLAR